MPAIYLTPQQAIDELKQIDAQIKRLEGRRELIIELVRTGGLTKPSKAKPKKAVRRPR
jgi:hypothetical protein